MDRDSCVKGVTVPVKMYRNPFACASRPIVVGYATCVVRTGTVSGKPGKKRSSGGDFPGGRTGFLVESFSTGKDTLYGEEIALFRTDFWIWAA